MTTDGADGNDNFPQPALDVLQHDQDEVRTELLDGFQNRRKIINWWQSAAVVTFGHIADEWPAIDLLRDRAMLHFLVGDSKTAATQRFRYYAGVVDPACIDAFNHLAGQAVERLPSGESSRDYRSINPETQTDTAMRPGFSVLDDRQQAVLSALWGGFRTREKLAEWLHELTPATYGEIDRTVARSFTSDRVARKYLLDTSSRDAVQYRERLAIAELLPAFATAAKRLQAGESTDDEDSGKSDFDSRG
jgi:hypothetical protein